MAAFFHPILPELSLIPDGYVEFVVNSRIVPCFIEVDLGNESMWQFGREAQKYVALSLVREVREAVRFTKGWPYSFLVNSGGGLQTIRKAVALSPINSFSLCDAWNQSAREIFGSVWCDPLMELPNHYLRDAL